MGSTRPRAQLQPPALQPTPYPRATSKLEGGAQAPRTPYRQNPRTGWLWGQWSSPDEMARGKGLEAGPWPRLTRMRPRAAEGSFLKARCLSWEGVFRSPASTSQAGDWTGRHPGPPLPAKTPAEPLPPGQRPFNRQLGPKEAPGVSAGPSGRQGGGGRRSVRLSPGDLAGTPGNRPKASRHGSSTRRQRRTAAFSYDRTLRAPPKQPGPGFGGGMRMGRGTSSACCGITGVNSSLTSKDPRSRQQEICRETLEKSTLQEGSSDAV